MGERHVLRAQQFVVQKGGDPQGDALLAQLLQFDQPLVVVLPLGREKEETGSPLDLFRRRRKAAPVS